MLLDGGGKSRELIASFQKAQTREAVRKCPICDRKMEKVAVGEGAPALMIDRCARGDGLWFDKGELGNIIDRAKLDEGDKIKKVLTEMFRHKAG